jgi:hypothetical protein
MVFGRFIYLFWRLFTRGVRSFDGKDLGFCKKPFSGASRPVLAVLGGLFYNSLVAMISVWKHRQNNTT